MFDKHLCFHLCQAILIQFCLIIITSIKPLPKMLSLRYFQEWQLYRVRPLNRIRSHTLTIYIIDNTLYNNLKVVSRLSNLRSYYHDRCLSPISAVLSILCLRWIISVSFFYNEFIFFFLLPLITMSFFFVFVRLFLKRRLIFKGTAKFNLQKQQRF